MRRITFLTILASICLAMPAVSSAQQWRPVIDGIKYFMKGGSLDAEVMGVDLTTHVGEDIVIPSTVEYHTGVHSSDIFRVTTIGEGAFSFDGLTGTVTFPESITTIANRAFLNSKFTGELIIPSSVSTIGASAFYTCKGFTGTLVIPDKVSTINAETFFYCSGFSGLKLGSRVSSIGDHAFANCTGLSGTLTIPSNVRTISSYAFAYCYGLKELIIENGVTSIGEDAFNGCEKLTGSLTIPNSVKTIGDGVFAGCGKLNGTLTLSESLTSLGIYVFTNCKFSKIVALNPTPAKCSTSGSEAIVFSDDLKNNVPLIVPGGSLAAYKASPVFSGFNTMIVELTDLTLDPESWIGKVNDTFTITPKFTPLDATETALTWTSSDESVATVDEEGKVTAVGIGTATITATGAHDLKAECAVTVEGPDTIDVTDITLDPETWTGKTGDSVTIVATVNPSDATDPTLTWTSSDESVATVDEEGNVTAVGPGTATITATSINDITANCAITVENPVIDISDVTLNPESWIGKPGDTVAIVATVTPSDATDPTLTWTSSDESVATVDKDGKVTAVGPGTATITATAINDVSADCEVTVEEPTIEVTEVTLDPESWTGKPGDTVTIAATVTPSDATDPTLTWTSSDESVATVDKDGKVTAVGPGTATITATAINDVSADCEVTVEEPTIEVTEVTLDPESWTGKPGDTVTIAATVTPSDATDPTLTWTSSDESVATVDEEGNVTAVGPGTATITATATNDVSADCEVTVEDTSTGVVGVDADGMVSVVSSHGTIIITAPAGAEVEVHSISGALVAKTTAHRINDLPGGFYIITLQGKSFKVIL